MIGALSIMAKTPCLIGVVNDGDGPDLVVVEPLQFIEVVYCLGDRVHKIDKKSIHHGKGLADA